MSLEYRLTLAGTVPMDEVAARAFPDPADRPVPSPSGKTLAINLDDRYGFTVSVLVDEDGLYGAPPKGGDDFEYWEWEPGAAVDLTISMTWGGDRFPAALRSAVTAIARVLASGTEDAAIMLSGDLVLLTRVNGVVTKYDRSWWEHYPWANDLIPG
jgi:hypothetical protein